MLANLTNFFKSWQTTIYAALIALTIGFASGVFVAHKFHQASKVAQIEKTQKLSDKSIDASNKIEKDVVVAKSAEQEKHSVITKEIIKYVPKTITTSCKDDKGNTIATTLSNRAVSVLSGDVPEIQPSGEFDAEGETPSKIGLQELSLEYEGCRTRYEQLSIEHNGLVDYSEEYKKLIESR